MVSRGGGKSRTEMVDFVNPVRSRGGRFNRLGKLGGGMHSGTGMGFNHRVPAVNGYRGDSVQSVEFFTAGKTF